MHKSSSLGRNKRFKTGYPEREGRAIPLGGAETAFRGIRIGEVLEALIGIGESIAVARLVATHRLHSEGPRLQRSQQNGKRHGGNGDTGKLHRSPSTPAFTQNVYTLSLVASTAFGFLTQRPDARPAAGPFGPCAPPATGCGWR